MNILPLYALCPSIDKLKTQICEFDVYYLRKSTTPGGSFAYLQGLRTKRIAGIMPGGDPEKAEAAKFYHNNKVKFATWMAEHLDFCPQIILSPPSRFPADAALSRDSIKNICTESNDISDRYKKNLGIKSGDPDVTLDQIINDTKYSRMGDEVDFKSVLIVDDILNSGKTASAIINALFDAGMPKSARVAIAALWWNP